MTGGIEPTVEGTTEIMRVIVTGRPAEASQ